MPSMRLFLIVEAFMLTSSCSDPGQLRTKEGRPAQLDIRKASDHSVRITLKPIDYENEFPFSTSIAKTDFEKPVISLRAISSPVHALVGSLTVFVKANPLTITIENKEGKRLQELVLEENGNWKFLVDKNFILGMGEGGPLPEKDWRARAVEYNRKGRFYEMRPRWQADAYGSRNPVPLLVGTGGWGILVASPWVEVDLCDDGSGKFIPWNPHPVQQLTTIADSLLQGRPPASDGVAGLWDILVFDTTKPTEFLKELAVISGPAVMPPKWAFGYMQSHRTLENDGQMISIVDTFRKKRIPIDAVIYLGTGFCPRGWNTPQPSLEFNPEVFQRDPVVVLKDLKKRNVKTVVHIVPWNRDQLPTLQGTIPPKEGEVVDRSHILTYWRQHIGLVEAGVDAFWPDEGDWYNLHERVKRHQLYYQGPLSTKSNVRPWSLHRNGSLGVAQWGGWVWSGDTESSWKTLEAQIATGLNSSLSLSPYWGSDIGGFFPNSELTGELYARWFQFGSFTASFRSHGKTWWTRLPWGWGLNEMGPLEHVNNPLKSALNDKRIEPICKKYAELRYQLIPYTYTLAMQARESGLPLMRSMWIHYPKDKKASTLGDQYLWGEDILVAPVYEKGATSRTLYLPEGAWYDWWTNEKIKGGKTITRNVDLATMPIYIRAGAIIPFDPVKQHTAEISDHPVTIKVFTGKDGQFAWYEDDGISLNYLKEEYLLTQLSWNEAKRNLSIRSKGNFRSPPRTFVIQLVNENVMKSIKYNNESISVSF